MQTFNAIHLDRVNDTTEIQAGFIKLFEEQVSLNPMGDALVFENNVWSYEALNRICNKLANYLTTAYGIGEGSLAGIITDRSDLTVLSMLAVMKTGAAFVPIDPGSPAKRVSYIAQDTNMKVLLLQSSRMFDLHDIECPLFALDLQLDGLETPDVNNNVESQSSDLAYVIYTSGTTGLPKGVMIESGALENYINFIKTKFDLTREDKTVLLSSMAFDLGYTGLFGSLASGGTLHIVADDFGKTPEKVLEYMVDAGITYLKTTPSMFFILTHVPSFAALAQRLSLRLIVLGGEAINCEDIERFWRVKPETKFVNHYGPTEATIGTVVCPIEPETFQQFKKQPVIGKSISNNKVVTMNKNFQLSPVGIQGEVCIGGKGLARGYLNNPELTHEKFIVSDLPNHTRLYKTGDFGKRLSNGNLVFLGRKDSQVKIRGYRVELDEITKVIQQHNNVSDAKVIARRDLDDRPYLIAYLILKDTNVESDIRKELTKSLPEYMIPAYFVSISEFPVTANGKLDEKALPDPNVLEQSIKIKEPTSELEHALCIIWKDVLNKKDIGVDQSFFEIGGDSIKAIQVASRTYEMKYKLEVKDIFQYPTIEQLALQIKPLHLVADQTPVVGDFPLTPIQKRFFQSEIVQKNHYNQSVMLFSEKGFEEKATHAVFKKLVDHHDVLRATFKRTEDNEVYGVISRDSDIDIQVVDLRGEPSGKMMLVGLAEKKQASLNIDNGPLLRMTIFKLDDGDRLHLAVHHLLVDGVSWRILLEDIGRLYQAYENNKLLELPSKTHSYKEWAEKIQMYARSDAFKREFAFWESVEKKSKGVIPYDNVESGQNVIHNSHKISFTLSPALTQSLLNEVNWLYKTSIKDLLLAALGIAIKKTFDLNTVVIEQEGHGREEIIDSVDISRTVGWFTSKYPVVLDMTNANDVNRHIIDAKESLRKIPYNGVGYGIYKYLTSGDGSTVNKYIQPQISFNYLGQFDGDIAKSSFQIAPEPCGNQVDINEELPYDLDISGMVTEQQLSVNILFSISQFENKTIQAFSDQFENALTEIAALSGSALAQQSTPSDYLYKKLTVDKVIELQRKYDIENIYPLSPMQQGLFYHTLMDPLSTAYYSQTAYRITGKLEPELVQKSLNYLFRRHDVFRGIFLHKDLAEPIQVILKERNVDFTFQDFRSMKSRDEKMEKLSTFKKEDRKKLIDLSKDALVRIAIIQLDHEEYELIWNDHHILKDGWSTGIIMSEFLQTYYSFIQQEEPELPPVKPYMHYLQWLDGVNLDESRSYWTNYLSEYETPFGVSLMKKNVSEAAYNKTEKTFTLSESKTQQLEQLARDNGVTLNTLMQSVWGVVLAKYNRTNDIVFGNVVSGRPAEVKGIESMVGIFINTIPVRIRFEHHDAFVRLLKEVHRAAGESAAHHYISLAEIQSASPLKKSLIDHVLIFDNYPIASKVKGVKAKDDEELSIPRIKDLSINDHAHYDFSIVLGPASSLSIKFDYNASVFDSSVIDSLADALLTVIDQVIEQPDRAIDNLEMVPAGSSSALYKVEGSSELAINELSFIELFNKWVIETPSNIALTVGDAVYTYRELNKVSNGIASQLKAQYNINPGDRVGIMLEASEWAIIAMLGIMKAGACFVPVDIELPLERRKHIIEDADLKVLILQSDKVFDIILEGAPCELFAVDIQFDSVTPVQDFSGEVYSEDAVAYAIYTSGTTGKPKGVMISQKALLNYVSWFRSISNLTGTDSGLLLTSHVFDLGYTTIFGCLGSGANLHLTKEAVGKKPEAILEYIDKNKISFIKATPSIFYMLTHIPQFDAGDSSLTLKWIFLGGEKIKPKDIIRFRAKYPDTQFVNHYGPTETTIGVIACVIDNLETFEHNPVIGKPIANTQVYLLDEKLSPVPPGAVGEICISGAGLAKGYINLDELTNEKFIRHPFVEGARLYKSGDLGRLNPDGTICIMGRKDGQLKVNGYRVEADEIVNCLTRCDLISDAALRVVQNNQGENQLIAYCVTTSFDEAAIRQFMLKNLPAYMVPTVFIPIDMIPVTANGKLNTKALPDVEQQKRTLYKSPETPLQENLVTIWKDVLQRNNIGITDNFFTLGGDSIKAVRLAGAINITLEQLVEVKDIFEHQDIESLSGFLQKDRQLVERQKQIENAETYLNEFKQDILNQKVLKDALPASWEDFFPMSDIQLGMLYHGFITPAEGVYHQVKFSQFRDESFSFDLFTRAIKLMVQKHPILRTTFDLNNFDIPIQIIHKTDASSFMVSFEDLSSRSRDEIIDYLQLVKAKDVENYFRDGKNFLWRLYAYKLSSEEYGMLFTYHHAILDGWSEASFYADLSNCYYALKENPSHQPASLRASYKDYIVAQLVNKNDERAKEFWQRNLDGYERTHLPFQKQIDKLTNRKQSVSRPLKLPADMVQKLDTLASQKNIHIREIFLAAYIYLLKVTTGKNDITIGLVTNCRPEKSDGDKVLGCFLNTIPYRHHFTTNTTIGKFIAHVAGEVNDLRQYDRYPLPDILKALGEETGNYNPIYDNRFDYVDFYIDKSMHSHTEVARPLISGRGNSDHRFSLNIRRSDDEITVRFFYLDDLYKTEEVERIEQYYNRILDQLLNCPPDDTISPNNILSDAERNELLVSNKLVNADYPRERIHTLFEKVVRKFPDNVAIICDGTRLSYKELNERANRLAHYLIHELGVRRNDLIGVMVGRNEMLPVAILGVLKSGAAYVPMDPDYPADRNQYILEDANVTIVVGDGNTSCLSQENVNVVNIESADLNLHKYETGNPPVINTPSDIAYIIYTSGSTGKPKGVVVEHENVVRLLFNDAFQFDFSENDTWTLFHSICFDFSVWEMYGALLYGGKLVIVTKDVARTPASFAQLIAAQGVTVLNQVPAMFDNVSSEVKKQSIRNLDLRYVIFGGAALKPQNLTWWTTNFPEVKMINMYGITETTVHVTYKEIDSGMIANGQSNIGKPIPTLQTFIMDDGLNLVPVNVPGEIVVGGKGVARGYLNRPELTNERFKPSPYANGKRVYVSGDLGYKDENGEIIYLGRRDSQIKLRGFRIEIGEIENAIIRYESVQNVVVLLQEGTTEDEKQLIAYIVTDKELDVHSLRDHLLKTLPDYMVPSQFIGLKEFPLTANKKIDFKALLKIQGYRLSSGVDFVAPQNPLQSSLIAIWQDELQVDKIGIKDNFFALGGDSLKAIRLVAKMNAVGFSLKIADLFKYPTIEELTSTLLCVQEDASVEDERNIGLALIKEFKQRILSDESQKEKLPHDWADIYPMTPIENGMIYSSILNAEHPVYYDQFTYKLSITDYNKFIEACVLMIQRHDILRTSYYLGTFSEPLKVVRKSIEPPIYLDDLSFRPEEEQKTAIKTFLKRDLDTRLSFEGEIPWHMQVFRLSGTSYFLVWNFHHAILDGWSISQFKIELSKLLAAGVPTSSVLDTLTYSYKDYCAIVLGRKVSQKTDLFWKSQLDGFSQNKLPFNYSGKQKSNVIGAKIIQTLVETDTLEALERLSRKHGVSFKSICLAAHVYLLHIICSEEDVVTGVVSHDRQAITDGDKILGCFLNTVPFRVNIKNAKDNLDLIKNVDSLLSATREHEIHLTDIARITGEKTSMGNPIFDTILNYTDFHVLETWNNNKTLTRKLDAVGVTKELKGSEMTNTLFDVEVSKTLGRFNARIKYRSSYFDDDDMKRALELYVRILRYFTTAPQGAIDVEPLLDQQELQEIVYSFNDTCRSYSHEKSLHQLFEDTVDQSPESIALRVGGKSITYRELNNRINKLAHELIHAGVKPQDNVGLIAKRNEQMIIGMLAILKTGGAYVPVDPEYPVSRQEYILENSSVTWVLSDDMYEIEDGHTNFKFITMRGDQPHGVIKNPGLKIDTSTLAYTIYTSGSTGKPKGVMIEHRSAVNLVEWVNKTFHVSKDDRLLFVTSMCFDLSVYDIFGMLACGGTVVMATKDDVSNLQTLKRLLIDERITFWDSVPTTMNYLVNELAAEATEFIQHDLRLVFMSGDWIPVSLPDKIVKFFPNAEVISLGGATEGTVWSNYYPVERGNTHTVSIPYGKPIANNFFYILDSNLKPVPKGVVGELYIGGIGVARGYANNEDKTNAAFVEDPFIKALGGRMYRTGDLGRMMGDNNMEFIGRRDHQTKIRGYRVELGEIQSLLTKNDRIKEAVVEVFKDNKNDNYLCAYIVPKETVTPEDVRAYLAQSLPGYMIPAYIEFLHALPLNSNGKIDRKQLPVPDQSKEVVSAAASPKSATEVKLSKLMTDILGKPVIGVHDNFFDLGAHSLNISAFVNRVHKQLDIELSIRDVFINPTVQGIAALVESKHTIIYEEITIVEEQEYYGATHSQKRFWFLQEMESGQIAYNMPSAYHLEGDINVSALGIAVNKLVERHESLRTTFVQVGGELMQKVNSFDPAACNLVSLDLRDVSDKDKTARLWAEKIAKTRFDLEKGPLLQSMILQLEDKKFVLLFSIHHIISDGWSKGIFLNELIRFYNAAASGHSLEIKPLQLQYKDYASWQNANLRDDSLLKHRNYWMDQFNPMPPAIHLPYDFERPAVNSYTGKEIAVLFSPEITTKINDLGKKHEASLFMVAVAAVNTLLHGVTGQHDFVIGTPIAGRDHQVLRDQIGLYLNTIPLRTRLDPAGTFSELLKRVKDMVLSGFEHQVYPFDKLVGDLRLKRDLNKNPLFNVWLVLQNMDDDGDPETDIQQVRIKRFGNDFNVSRYDLRFTFQETSKGLMVSLNYSTDLFKDDTAKGMLGLFESIINEALDYPTNEIQKIASECKTKLRMNANGIKTPALIKRSRNKVSENGSALVKESSMITNQSLPYKVESNRKGVDLESWIAGHRDKIKNLLLEHGAVLFRNFEVNGILEFEKAVSSYGENMLTYDFASTPRTRLQGKIYTSTEYPASQEILMHNEMAYTNNYPRHLWFYCNLPANEGGETPILNSAEVYTRLDANVRDLFERKKLLYVRHYHEKLDLSWRKVFQTDSKTTVEDYCRNNGITCEWIGSELLKTSECCEAVREHPVTKQKVWFNQAHLFHISNVDPALREELRDLVGEYYPRNVYFGDGSEINEDFLTIIRASLANQKVTFPWQQSDVLLVDNILVAHGRMPYKGDRKVIVAMTK